MTDCSALGGGVDHDDVGSTEVSMHSPGPQYTAETERARSAAQHAGLGQPGQVFANTKLGFAWQAKETGWLVYEFDGGLVSQQVGGPTEVFPWARIIDVKRIGQHQFKNGRYACTLFVYTITRDDGKVMELTGSYLSPDRSDRADPESVGARFNKFGAVVTQRVSAARLPEARAALARGEILTFGQVKYKQVKISADGVVLGKGVVAWNVIREVKVDNGNLYLYQTGKRLSLLGVPVSGIPSLPLLLTLIEELRTRAR